MSSHSLVLLTGAGYTKNYGGFLAREMWARIFNNPAVQQTPRLRELLLSDFDFEAVYAKVIQGEGYGADEQAVLASAVDHAYKMLDDAIRGWVHTESGHLSFDSYGVGRFINLFSGTNSSLGYIFTLNQDLLMERQYGHHSPGVPKFPDDLHSLKRELTTEHYITLPSADVEERMRRDLSTTGNIAYIKLHGSYGWTSSDGKRLMVLGHNKVDGIAKEPLLRAYHDEFKRVIAEGNKKIVVAGYSFRDRHINEVLAAGVEQYGLKIFVLSPLSIDDFKKNLEGDHSYASGILNGLTGYFPFTLRELFPADQSGTVFMPEIEAALKG